MSHEPRSNATKILLIVLAVIVVIAIGIFVGLKREPYTTWKENDSKLAMNKHGDLLGLSLFYQQHNPKLKQQVWRVFKDNEPPLANQSQHLLFIHNTNNMTSSQFNQLLAWAAQGNHIVMPVHPYHAPDADEESAHDSEKAFPEAWN